MVDCRAGRQQSHGRSRTAEIAERTELRAVLQGIAEGAFRPILDAEVPLGEARRAHERLEQRENFGKVVLVT